MIETAQLIYICDHVVDSISKTFTADTIIRDSNSNNDLICPGFIIGNIYCLSTTDNVGKSTFYYENIHYQKVATDTIQWITDIKPSNGTPYIIEYLKINRTVVKYEQEYCTECNGNGWYVDIANRNGSSVEKISGQDKIMQDFVKIVLTSSDDGTPDIYSFTGSSDYINTPEQISAFIKKCEDKYMQKQLSIISSGTQLGVGEILNKALVTEIDYDKDLGAYYISITLITNSGGTINVGLKI